MVVVVDRLSVGAAILLEKREIIGEEGCAAASDDARLE